MENIEIPKALELKFNAFVRNLSSKWVASIEGYDRARKVVTGIISPKAGDSIDGFTIEVDSDTPYVYITNSYGEQGEYNFEDGLNYINRFNIDEEDYSFAKKMDVDQKAKAIQMRDQEDQMLTRVEDALKSEGFKFKTKKSKDYSSIDVLSESAACIVTVDDVEAKATIVKDGKVEKICEADVSRFTQILKTLI